MSRVSLHDVLCLFILFFFNDTATTEIYTLSLHDALPIYSDTCDWPPHPNTEVLGYLSCVPSGHQHWLRNADIPVRSRIARSVWSAWSLLPLSNRLCITTAPASWTHL